MAFTWKTLFGDKTIKISKKIKLFEAVAQWILTYGAQIGGGIEFEDLERAQRFFVKRSFHMLRNSPNYLLITELETPTMFIKTLTTHLRYLRSKPTKRTLSIRRGKRATGENHWGLQRAQRGNRRKTNYN